ncbi:MAG: preprotein translocase subunit SecA [Betaproteobacteria bacterium]|nr:preprotein translocase subunit SecA [Betaproteobacteria bacterium]
MSDSVAMRLAPDAVYPQHEDLHEPSLIERGGRALYGWTRRKLKSSTREAFKIVAPTAACGPEFDSLELEQLREPAREIGRRLRSQGLEIAHVARSFALIRRASQLTLGKRHFDVQVVGAWVMLQGMIAEMQTGEGKTLTATLAAATAALAGRPVHVITVNDYLVARDAELMRPVYEALGLTVSAVTAEMEHADRQVAYMADIVYCSNKTVVFDYLRDRIILGATASELQLKVEALAGPASRTRRLLLRGLHYAIVDEADSVLVDEARTPLIISANAGSEGDEITARKAYELAIELIETEHYRVHKGDRRVVITEAGRQRLIDLSERMGGLWAVPIRREEVVLRALTAIHLFHRDEHYLVRDGKIQVIDEFTGRVMADRSWGQGLHQIIEVKEDVEVTEVRETLAKISYQRFFRRYLHLSGMTGTAQEVKAEMGSVYDLPVVTVPTHRKPRRINHPDRVFATDDQKWAALVARVETLNAIGAPVLIGTRSVAAAEVASAALTARGLPHVLLSAKQDETEAEVVAHAGEAGRVTIATNMAGRGTDIALGEGVEEKGGLHVILTERHEAGRIDRQLAGRAARQGDPGSAEALLSLEDAILLSVKGGPVERLLMAWSRSGLPYAHRAPAAWIRYAQWRTERGQSVVRRQLLKSDRQLSTTLSFSGRPE